MLELFMRVQFFYLVWMRERDEKGYKFLVFPTIRKYTSPTFIKDIKE